MKSPPPPGKTTAAAASTSASSPASNVVELSRFRADLSHGRRMRRADALTDTADPRAAIRALPGDELYYVVHELGFPDGLEVLQHATPDQVQVALDFALWDRDQLDPVTVENWLGAMIEAPAEALASWIEGLDIELFALLLRKRARIFDLSVEEPPDESEGALYPTPDNLFVIEALGSEDEQNATLALLDVLYRHDHEWMRRILVGTRGEVDVELEEMAWRWRSGRMADLGFEDYYTALEVYRELDPASVRPGATPNERVRPLSDEADERSMRLPAALTERLAASSPFARVLAGINDKQELANLQTALVSLSNRVLSADRITPGDDEAVAATLERMAATLDLAIEFLERAKHDDGVQAVRTIPLTRLFRLGVSLIGKVQKLATTLARRTPFSRLRPTVDLFEHEDTEVIEACSRLRPEFPRLLDSPPVAGRRPFASLADLGRATTALERIGASLTLLYQLGVRPDDLESDRLAALGIHDAATLDAGLIGRTLLVLRSIEGKEVRLRALTPPESAALKANVQAMTNDPSMRATWQAKWRAALAVEETNAALRAASEAVVERWIGELIDGAPVLRA